MAWLISALEFYLPVAWVIEHWYWLVGLWLVLFAIGVYRHREKEKRRAKLTDSELAARLGDVPGSGGTLESYADAELPTDQVKRPPR